jgi:leucyl aminopeptidase
MDGRLVWPDVSRHFAADGAPLASARPIWLATETASLKNAGLTDQQRAWLAAQDFKPSKRRAVVMPSADGQIAGIALGAAASKRDWMIRAETLIGGLAATAPAGTYRIEGALSQPELAGIAWGLGGYVFRRYKTNSADDLPRLHLPANANASRVKAIVEGVHFGRDLINTPASDLGPGELEAAARLLADKHGASISVIVGNDLLQRNFPMIHAVGRASSRPPRLIDFSWGNAGPKITLVGKGICFDTGGLDIKPSSSMLLMKKDMGGAAAVLALAHMIMAAKLPVRLRVLIAAAENSISGNAFRPGDVLKSRNGLTVEIGNTDAEGRLVLADAMSVADEERPDLLVTMSTLTGAARTAVGPELTPYYCDDDAFAASLDAAGKSVADPVWRMPFWTGYESMLDSPVADMNNVSESPFAGSIVAALFLRKFLKASTRYAHFDIYGWRPSTKSLGPRGGEVQSARALFDVIRTMG